MYNILARHVVEGSPRTATELDDLDLSPPDEVLQKLKLHTRFGIETGLRLSGVAQAVNKGELWIVKVIRLMPPGAWNIVMRPISGQILASRRLTRFTVLSAGFAPNTPLHKGSIKGWENTSRWRDIFTKPLHCYVPLETSKLKMFNYMWKYWNIFTPDPVSTWPFGVLSIYVSVYLHSRWFPFKVFVTWG